jgi:hypothetical protein
VVLNFYEEHPVSFRPVLVPGLVSLVNGVTNLILGPVHKTIIIMIIIIIIILKFPILKIRPSSDPILTNPDCNQRLTLTVDYSPALINHFFSSKQCNLIRVLGFRVLIPVLGKSNPSSFSCLFYYLSNWKHNQATIRTYPTLLL